MTAAPDRVEIREQTAILTAYLKSCCGICGIPHDPAVHAAVLRLREPLPERDYLPNPGAALRHGAICATVTPVIVKCACGAEFPTLNARVAKAGRCPDCLGGAVTTTRWPGSRRNA